MAKKNQMQKRIESEQQTIKRITNNDLVCKDCVQRYNDDVIFGNTTKCEFYQICKPNKVLLGGKCDEYVRE